MLGPTIDKVDVAVVSTAVAFEFPGEVAGVGHEPGGFEDVSSSLFISRCHSESAHMGINTVWLCLVDEFSHDRQRPRCGTARVLMKVISVGADLDGVKFDAELNV